MTTGPVIDRLGASGLLVLGYARQAADELEVGGIEPVHLLLGLGRLGDLDVRGALSRAGVDLLELCTVLVRDHERRRRADALAPDDATEQVLRAAEAEAARLGAKRVEALHLVLGLLTEDDGNVTATIRGLGVDPAAVATEVEKAIVAGSGVPSDFYRPREHVEQAGRAHATDLLETLGRDLTAEAEAGKLTPIIGRDREIDALVTTLLSMRANNAVLVGDAGVGKTAVVEGLAQRIVDGGIPQLKGTRIRTIEVGALVAGTRYRGEFEQRLTDLIEGLSGRRDVILFIDELHMIVGAGEGGRRGSVDAANMLKPTLARGDLRVIGATTLVDYRLHIEPDDALARRFQRIVVGEPSPEETRAILSGLRPRYEHWHVVRITDAALDAALDLSQRHVPDRNQPDKALELLDAACTRTKLAAPVTAPRRKRVDATVDADDVTLAASLVLGVPVGRLQRDERRVLTDLPTALKARVLGQDGAIDAVAQALVRTATGFAPGGRPAAVLLFVGPTGTGKTTLARALAAALFDDAAELVEVDLGRYRSAGAVAELVGAPLGIAGWDRGGRLTNAVRARPYSVVLLEDVDQAHPAVIDLIGEILATGQLADALDRVVDFRNSVVVMTTNTGGAHAVGFVTPDDLDDEPSPPSSDATRQDLDGVLPADLVRLVDEVVAFARPTRDVIRAMVTQQLAAMPVVDLDVTHEATELLADAAFTPAMGAHLVWPTLQRLVANPLSVMVANDELTDGDHVRVDVDRDALTFAPAKRKRRKPR